MNNLLGFHPIAELGQKIEDSKNVRSITGEGTLFLKVPGLKELHSVRAAGVEMPKTQTVSYPADMSMRQETMEIPLVHFTHLPDGTPILLRNVISNDGYWQAGQDFQISGVWDEKVSPLVERRIEVVPVKKGVR